jgi:hypothetical protein
MADLAGFCSGSDGGSILLPDNAKLWTKRRGVCGDFWNGSDGVAPLT